MVQFFYITQSIYDELKTSNKLVDSHLYFIKGGKRLYRGAELIASSGEADEDLAALEAAILTSNQAIASNANNITSLNDLILAHVVVTDEMQKTINSLSQKVENLEKTTIDLSTNYNETIIGLSIDGRTITYVKGDGSSYSFETQDTDTTYSLGTDEKTGLTKLYAITGSAEDGTMTQKAITTELNKKVEVSMDDSKNMLIFTT